jgi:hypothetical protein
VGSTPLEVWLIISKRISMLWWTGVQADRHEREDGHATVLVAALASNKAGIERKKGNVHEIWPESYFGKKPSTPCVATHSPPTFFCR